MNGKLAKALRREAKKLEQAEDVRPRRVNRKGTREWIHGSRTRIYKDLKKEAKKS
jgi:hypothetical protein